jgi:glycerol-3-phosphate acyltransferase PlsX
VTVGTNKIVLALDGMGGDHAPDAIVNGADIARERYPGTSFLLFGDEARLKALVDKRKGLAQVLEIVPSEDAVKADDKPSFALRRRPQVRACGWRSRPRPRAVPMASSRPAIPAR